MIAGVGIDLTQIGRIEKSLARPGFWERVYGARERALLAQSPRRGQFRREGSAGQGAGHGAFSGIFPRGGRGPARRARRAVLRFFGARGGADASARADGALIADARGRLCGGVRRAGARRTRGVCVAFGWA